MEEFRGLFSSPINRLTDETDYPKRVVLAEKYIERGGPFDMFVDGEKARYSGPVGHDELLKSSDWQRIEFVRANLARAPGWDFNLGRDGVVTVEVRSEAEEKHALGMDEEVE